MKKRTVKILQILSIVLCVVCFAISIRLLYSTGYVLDENNLSSIYHWPIDVKLDWIRLGLLLITPILLAVSLICSHFKNKNDK